MAEVDVRFDCRQDAGGKDPDSHSPTLRRFHQFLWSKPLPGSRMFDLDISGPKPFLVHRSELGEFHLTSDGITHSYSKRKEVVPYLHLMPEDQRAFVTSWPWLIQESIVFPGRMVDGKVTINGARGMNRKIGDRFDLTLECIRRHYLGEASPLKEVLDRNAPFFALFGDFRGYVEFFLLQDLVTGDGRQVRFYLPCDDFQRDPIPSDLESYQTYFEGVLAFSAGRAKRIQEWSANQSQAR